MQPSTDSFPPSLLSRALRGRHLAGPTLADNLAGGPTLIVFLRHFG